MVAAAARRPCRRAHHPAYHADGRRAVGQHLAAFRPPATLRRIYVAQDNDPAGERATQQLSRRAQAAGIEALPLTPSLKDFNEDPRHLGVDALRAALREQLAPEDAVRFMAPAAGPAG
jgi:hypothetical protein